jgi:RNA polymerase-interacting CarD/CdnL/TRCF family regulator
MEKIKTGSLFEVAEVYRDLSLLKHHQRPVLWRAQTLRHRPEPSRQRAVHGQEQKRKGHYQGD